MYSYLLYYPNGLFQLEANYFLYKSYDKLDDVENAMISLTNIVNDQEGVDPGTVAIVIE